MEPSSSIIKNAFTNVPCTNPDILATIFAFLTVKHSMNIHEAQKSRTTLLSAALTCKSFTECALDALWRVIPSLLPLLNLLPSFVKNDDDGVYILKYVEEEAWDLYETYARRVREIVFQRADETRISPLVYLQLVRMRPPTTPLIPCLKTIRVDHGTQTKIDPTLLLLLANHQTERLDFLDRDNVYGNQFWTSFLATLSQSPGLKQFTIISHENIDLSIIRKLPNIQVLKLCLPNRRYSTSFIRSLGALRHLQSLTLDVGHLSARQDVNEPCKLPTLQRLRLIGHPNALAATFIDVQPTNLVHFCAFETLCPHINSQTSTSWQLLFSRLASFPNLASVEINQLSFRRWGDHGHSLSMDDVLPLVNHPNPSQLQSFTIIGGRVSTPESTGKFFKAFQHLRVFKLPLATHGSTINISGAILHIFYQSPMLATLQIMVEHQLSSNDKANIKQQLSLPLVGNPRPLKNLFLNPSLAVALRSTPEDALTFAEFIDVMFPQLQTMRHPDDKSNAWGWVDQMASSLRRARGRQSMQNN
ncbi:hypothetical protein CVT24_008477 [Panaeolus cyanescens]|uniref:F-box domain-containing protein n=1 Tax=Panaeolus cyanescens TaxID=181874 RepID=A0A409VEW4_9AGAR|nr:hypothetical protein CVT24_008477 [Panaeolus cyanescens]